MKILHHFFDTEYPSKEITHTRKIVRAVVVNDKSEIALTKIKTDDMFGHRDYYELPGGGVKSNEKLVDALKRELLEELGAEIKSEIIPIGRIIDFYNLIGRRNDNHFYICFVDSIGEKHLEVRESKLIEKIVWVNIDKAIELYNNMQDELVGKLVKNRELPIILIAKKKLSLHKPSL
jgi:8-oxo-dGTP pyrophosphatase MutT (NUDIX family)